MKKANISIFIPHLGCGKSCSFCNQNVISGQIKIPTIQEVRDTIKKSIENNPDINCNNTEIAFFGGSFTAINKKYMLDLLKVSKEFIDKKQVYGIRISTRPDCINEDILLLLKSYGVTSIELGCQSFDEEVLKENLRGHTSKDAITSSELIKEHGFSLGLQMMIGLYKDTYEKCIYTANEFVKLKPDTVRIYPTIIMPDTLLHKLYLEKKYDTFSLEEAINTTCDILEIFNNNNINVIKVGLHSDISMTQNYITGPYHPAFRELCESRIFYKKIYKEIKNKKKSEYTIFVNIKDISKVIGQNKCNIELFKKDGYFLKVVPDDNIKINDFLLSRRR